MIESLNPRAFGYQEPAPAAPPAGTTSTGAPAQPAPQPPGFGMLVPLVIMFVLFYFILIKPQRKQQKEREKMISALKKNDHVITTGGLCGVVDRIKDNEVYLRVDEKSDVKLRVIRSHIAMVEKVSGADEPPEKK